ncbi:MAG: D-alanyl-D-alanine carboxypeptidase [Desulfobacterales bacterium]|nr:D-alanyl-D-alanine carboxypeptidase [Desulfobacterales bacterium]
MMIKRLLLLSLLLFLLFVTAFHPQSLAIAKDIQGLYSPEEMGFIENGGYAVKKDGRIIAAHNLHEKFVPASIVKIATSLTALRVLGPRYRFETHFYIDANQNLYIKGFGDPFLISEEISFIVRELKKLGCQRINNIYIDDTAFNIGISADGAGLSDNPYDAQNNALAVNFNTVNLTKEKTGKVHSAEVQTPTLPLMAELAEDLEPGLHRINISQDETAGHEIISRYTGELFRAFQHSENIPGEGIIASRKTPGNLPLFYKHQSSKALEDIIAPLMLYSNNFIANQLYLAVGAKVYGYPATWEKSRGAVADILLNEFGIFASEIRIVEGSGLSRKNLVSPYAMILLLDLFKPYSGFLPQEDGMFLKSGTLKGVYSFGGYFSDNNDLDSFVLMLNQDKNTRRILLHELEQIYKKY